MYMEAVYRRAEIAAEMIRLTSEDRHPKFDMPPFLEQRGYDKASSEYLTLGGGINSSLYLGWNYR